MEIAARQCPEIAISCITRQHRYENSGDMSINRRYIFIVLPIWDETVADLPPLRGAHSASADPMPTRRER